MSDTMMVLARLEDAERQLAAANARIAELEKDKARLEALLDMDVTVTSDEGGGCLLIDWRQNPVRSTSHPTPRDAIDAAIKATP